MDFYVTLPSNASMNIYPDNKKSNYTTQFNTPIRLDGNYEVALANITCTPNIKNDYGTIFITNFYELLYPFFPKEYTADVPLRLLDVKNLQDKINESQEQLAFFQIFLNTLFYQVFSEAQGIIKKDKFKDILPIFFDLNKINNSNFNYYIPQKISSKFDKMVPSEKENVKFLNNMVVLTREQFHYLVEENFSLFYYPMLVFDGVLDLDMAIEISVYYDKKLSDKSLTNEIYDKHIIKFKKIYIALEDSRHFTGLVSLKAEIKNDQIKFSSNVTSELKAEGIIKDLVF